MVILTVEVEIKSCHFTESTIGKEDEARKLSVKKWAYYDLRQTGVLDDETIKMMNMPRCGVKDNVGGGGHDQGMDTIASLKPFYFQPMVCWDKQRNIYLCRGLFLSLYNAIMIL